MQSGKSKITLPVAQAKSRDGLTASFALNYNSQMWRKDGEQRDLVLRPEQRLRSRVAIDGRSILPVHKAFSEVAFYVFTDSTGAESAGCEQRKQ